MPAGLDGNPHPIATDQRTDVITTVAAAIQARRTPGKPMLVAIDGIDGSGKSTFADELAAELARREVDVVRSTIDSFHNPAEYRYRKGKTSPAGFFLDSHDLAAVRSQLLEPWAAGKGDYVAALFDVEADEPVNEHPRLVRSDRVLVFDGIFVQRDELAGFWDFVVFVDGSERVKLSRLGHVLDDLPNEPIDVLRHTLEWTQRIDRYASGMRFYLDVVDPVGTADIVIDNNDIAAPELIKAPFHTMHIEHEIVIHATPSELYDMLSDITRIGEWSPECLTSEWISGGPGQVGSTFVGHNYERNAETGQEWAWEMTSEVVEATEPRAFAWSVLTEAWDVETSVWRFDIEPVPGAADQVRLRQTYRMKRPPQGWQPILDRHPWAKQLELVAARRARLDRGMQATLDAIAAAVNR